MGKFEIGIRYCLFLEDFVVDDLFLGPGHPPPMHNFRHSSF